MRKHTRTQKLQTNAALPDVQRILARHASLLSGTEPAEFVCPVCGTSFFAGPDQRDGLCFGCGNIVHPSALTADVVTQKLGVSFRSFSALLEAASSAAAQGAYDEASRLYEAACTARPDSAAAWRGLLMSRTQNLTAMLREFPEDISWQLLRVLPAEEAGSFSLQWSQYKTRCEQYFEELRRAEVRKEEAAAAAAARQQEEEKLARAKRREARKAARQTPERKRARRQLAGTVIGLVVTGAVVVVLLAAGVGVLAFFPLLMLGSGRGRDQSNRNNRNNRR